MTRERLALATAMAVLVAPTSALAQSGSYNELAIGGSPVGVLAILAFAAASWIAARNRQSPPHRRQDVVVYAKVPREAGDGLAGRDRAHRGARRTR